ncbi:uncharacterized protein DSM5745_07159 [Aspergillus mulundensis]|uniref:Uncharacterized protein n=1 Tax=Aspergillus mulundensis TaxID=1810919 RepID=A0A3D8RKB9_9EURO|nr:hypothetical protein DSM5745_07159 [Aspergillus mulundensis]RDW74497.1 hypothetical protein DSM5745_07159 [Aspergillus mulundensis]
MEPSPWHQDTMLSAQMSGLTLDAPMTPNPSNRFRYTRFESYLAIIRAHLGEAHELLEFTDVPSDAFDLLSSHDDRPKLAVKLSYNYVSRTLSVKLHGPAHLLITGLFNEMVNRQAELTWGINDVLCCASPLTVLGNNGAWYAKEPDTCGLFWTGPAMQLALRIVVVVGGVQCAGRLAEDARVWLETSGSTVEMVVTVDVSRCQEVLRVDVWERALGAGAVAVRAQYVEILRGDGAGADPEVRGWKRNTGPNGSEVQMNGNSDLVWTDGLFLDLARVTGAPVGEPDRGVHLHKGVLQEFGARFWRLLGEPLGDCEMN